MVRFFLGVFSLVGLVQGVAYAQSAAPAKPNILFALAEWLRRKPLNGKFVQSTWTAFATMLIVFLLYINLNDVWRMVRPSFIPGKAFETNAVHEVTQPPQK